MRLLDIEKKAFSHALDSVDGMAYIYGSRTDPLAKGGDIDLLIMSKTDDPYRLSQKIAVQFQMECDEKIDVLVVNPDCIKDEQKAFLSMIKMQAVKLK